MRQLAMFDPNALPGAVDLHVRAVGPSGGASYDYFDGQLVTPARALELARWYAYARCQTVVRYEVRTEISLYALPVIVEDVS